MKERPILFSDAMVRAILEGRKTQTRRVVKPKPPALFTYPKDGRPRSTLFDKNNGHRDGFYWDIGRADNTQQFWPSFHDNMYCPYGQPGDRLWVREAWYPSFKRTETNNGCVYRADCDGLKMVKDWSPKGNGKGWLPSIHMYRWASRILLEVTGVRVERLQQISYGDAIAEGAKQWDVPIGTSTAHNDAPRWSMEEPPNTDHCHGSPIWAFAGYINKLHGGENWNCKREPSLWEQDPWVWVIEFKRLTA